MKKKLQRVLCFIPYVSTIIILGATMVNLKRKQASGKIWKRFNLAFLITGMVLFFLDMLFEKMNTPILHTVTSILILTVANFFFVELQYFDSTSNKADQKKKIPQSVLIFVLIGVVILGVITCVFFMDDSPGYVDTNGAEDTSLVYITLDEILSTTYNYSATWEEHSRDGQQTLVPASLASTDYDTIVYRCKQIDGIQTLQTSIVNEDTVVLNIRSEVKSGNMEIVILVDNEYYDHVPVNCQQTVRLDEIAGKTIIVRMAAEGAEVDLTVERSIG